MKNGFSDSWLLGIDALDKGHMDMFQIIQTCKENKHPSTMVECQCFKSYLEQLKSHCEIEESLMEEWDYPNLQIHKSHHQKEVDRITAIQDEKTENTRSQLLDLLFKHIIKGDFDFATHYSSTQKYI